MRFWISFFVCGLWIGLSCHVSFAHVGGTEIPLSSDQMIFESTFMWLKSSRRQLVTDDVISEQISLNL